MNKQAIEKNWTELKTAIKTKWGKFNDQEIETLKADLSQLAGKIEKSYGLAKEHADKQFEEFKTSVSTLLGAEPAAVKPIVSVVPAAVAALDPAKTSQAV